MKQVRQIASFYFYFFKTIGSLLRGQSKRQHKDTISTSQSFKKMLSCVQNAIRVLLEALREKIN